MDESPEVTTMEVLALARRRPFRGFLRSDLIDAAVRHGHTRAEAERAVDIALRDLEAGGERPWLDFLTGGKFLELLLSVLRLIALLKPSA